MRPMALKLIFISLLAAILVQVSPPLQSSAQSLPAGQQAPTLTQELQPLLDEAKKRGLSVVIVSPEQSTQEAVDTGPSFGEQALKVRAELVRIFTEASDLPSAIFNTLQSRSPDGTFNWLWIAIATAVGGIVVGTVPTIATREWARAQFSNMYNPDAETRAEKISYLMFRAGLILVNLLLMGLIAAVVAVVFDSGHPPSYGTIGVIIGAYLSYRAFRHVVFFNLIVPDSSTHRVINLTDEAAEKMQTVWRNIALFVIVVSAFFVWLALLGMPGDPLKLLVIGSLLINGLVIGFGFIRFRKEIYGIVLGAGDPTTKPAWRRFLASQWHLLMIAYLIVAWIVSVARIVLNLPSALAVIGAPVVALIGGIAIYGLMLIVIDRFYGIRQRRFEERVEIARQQKIKEDEELEKARAEARAEAAAASEDADIEDDAEIISEVMSKNRLADNPVFRPVFKSVLEEAAGMLVLILSVAYILGAWDVNIGESGNPLTAFIDTLAIAFVGWFLYRAVVVYIDNQLEEEGEERSAEAGEPGEEMTGRGSSRLATLLPLLRNVLIATIAIMTVMIVLSNFGVDIAPLFAGAGVIGLAIGFGAQTLIRDIFSGGFFLFDDAFRKGEYIEMGDIRGTVEKISLRSFQLRHHNGPLHTIPFGEITQLTNYSRDWVMMKLPLRLTYDTDVERVRKLVKKLGQRLLEHPEVGHLFLQPLKSQGVYKMEDSAMIIRVKFMTKPGDQFVTRKVVYASIRDLFEQEGIRFASKEVTVRLADEPTRPLSDTDKQAIAAAAKRVQDDDLAAQQQAPEPDMP